MLVRGPNGYIKKRTSDVHDTKDFGPIDLACEVSKERERVYISLSLLVELAKIRTWSGSSFRTWFWRQMER